MFVVSVISVLMFVMACTTDICTIWFIMSLMSA